MSAEPQEEHVSEILEEVQETMNTDDLWEEPAVRLSAAVPEPEDAPLLAEAPDTQFVTDAEEGSALPPLEQRVEEAESSVAALQPEEALSEPVITPHFLPEEDLSPPQIITQEEPVSTEVAPPMLSVHETPSPLSQAEGDIDPLPATDVSQPLFFQPEQPEAAEIAAPFQDTEAASLQEQVSEAPPTETFPDETGIPPAMMPPEPSLQFHETEATASPPADHAVPSMRGAEAPPQTSDLRPGPVPEAPSELPETDIFLQVLQVLGAEDEMEHALPSSFETTEAPEPKFQITFVDETIVLSAKQSETPEQEGAAPETAFVPLTTTTELMEVFHALETIYAMLPMSEDSEQVASPEAGDQVTPEVTVVVSEELVTFLEFLKEFSERASEPYEQTQEQETTLETEGRERLVEFTTQGETPRNFVLNEQQVADMQFLFRILKGEDEDQKSETELLVPPSESEAIDDTFMVLKGRRPQTGEAIPETEIRLEESDPVGDELASIMTIVAEREETTANPATSESDTGTPRIEAATAPGAEASSGIELEISDELMAFLIEGTTLIEAFERLETTSQLPQRQEKPLLTRRLILTTAERELTMDAATVRTLMKLYKQRQRRRLPQFVTDGQAPEEIIPNQVSTSSGQGYDSSEVLSYPTLLMILSIVEHELAYYEQGSRTIPFQFVGHRF